jgi:hypothetical protein
MRFFLTAPTLLAIATATQVVLQPQANEEPDFETETVIWNPDRYKPYYTCEAYGKKNSDEYVPEFRYNNDAVKEAAKAALAIAVDRTDTPWNPCPSAPPGV